MKPDGRGPFSLNDGPLTAYKRPPGKTIKKMSAFALKCRDFLPHHVCIM